MRFTLLIRPANSADRPWRESQDKDEVTSMEEARSYGRTIVDRFNASLRAGEEPRELVDAVECNKRESDEFDRADEFDRTEFPEGDDE